MAIQTINLTVPGGDTPRSANTKINANFSNTSHAANKLVGAEMGRLPLAQDVVKALHGLRPTQITSVGSDADNFEVGTRIFAVRSTLNMPDQSSTSNFFHLIDTMATFRSDGSTNTQVAYGYTNPELAMRTRSTAEGGYTTWAYFYNSQNTTLDGNGALKPSSPVLRVFNDRIEGNADGDTMAATYTKNGVGDYTISGTTGLRTDGWYVVIPNDMNGNPKVAITLDDKDGVITLKTYVRIFDMSTFKFVPDLEQPLDIPEGRWVDLRFNDLPIAESADMPAQQPNN